MRAGPSCGVAHREDGGSNVYDDYFLTGTGPYETCNGVHTDPALENVAGVGDPTPAATTGLSVAF